eukprot:scaffold130313_cov39-Tisochrysis_lutea.AAC.1
MQSTYRRVANSQILGRAIERTARGGAERPGQVSSDVHVSFVPLQPFVYYPRRSRAAHVSRAPSLVPNCFVVDVKNGSKNSLRCLLLLL